MAFKLAVSLARKKLGTDMLANMPIRLTAIIISTSVHPADLLTRMCITAFHLTDARVNLAGAE
jgi:hypothetical protein